MAKIRRRLTGKLTPEARARHAEIIRQVQRERPETDRRAREKSAEITAAHEAMKLLKAERERRGLSLGEVAERSGIDKARLSKLETELGANPTFATVLRIAAAIGVTLRLSVADAA